MDNDFILFYSYSSIWLVMFILAWALHAKISIFCNIGKILKTSKRKTRFFLFFIQSSYHVFSSDCLRWSVWLLISLVLEWPEENYYDKWAKTRRAVQLSWKAPGGAMRMDSIHWHMGSKCLVPAMIAPPHCTDLFVVAYVLLDAVKKKNIWKWFYFVKWTILCNLW